MKKNSKGDDQSTEHPGYIIDMFDGSVWLTHDGKVTPEWDERGVWKTEGEAAEAMRKSLGLEDKRA